MDKNYNIPRLEVIRLSAVNIIKTSGEWQLPPVDFDTSENSPANTDTGE